MSINVGNHWSVSLPVDLGFFSTVHMDTLITAWIAMGVVLSISLLVTKNLNRIPSKIQLVAEEVMKFIDDISVSQMGQQGLKHTPLVGSIFLFVLLGNLMGQVPLKLIPLPAGEMASPTNDLNTTLGLALLVSIYYFYQGISQKGLSYFSHYLKPFPVMLPLNIIEDFTRLISLSMRLFGNILAGEVILGVLISFLTLFPFLIPITDSAIICFVLFELFVAVIQAFIFAVLAAAYVATATSESH